MDGDFSEAEYPGLLKSGFRFCGETKLAPMKRDMARIGRPKLSEKRDEYLKANAYPNEKRAFENACKKAKVSSPDALRALASAWVEYVDSTARPTLHIRVAPIHDQVA